MFCSGISVDAFRKRSFSDYNKIRRGFIWEDQEIFGAGTKIQLRGTNWLCGTNYFTLVFLTKLSQILCRFHSFSLGPWPTSTSHYFTLDAVSEVRTKRSSEALQKATAQMLSLSACVYICTTKKSACTYIHITYIANVCAFWGIPFYTHKNRKTITTFGKRFFHGLECNLDTLQKVIICIGIYARKYQNQKHIY